MVEQKQDKDSMREFDLVDRAFKTGQLSERSRHEEELIKTHNNAIKECIDIVWFTDFGLPSHKDYKFNEDRKKCDLCKLFTEMKKEMLKHQRVFGGEKKQ